MARARFFEARASLLLGERAASSERRYFAGSAAAFSTGAQRAISAFT